MRLPSKKKFITFVKNNKLLIVAIIYLVFPFDFIPDFVPALGYTEDIGLLLFELGRRFFFGGTDETDVTESEVSPDDTELDKER